MFQLDKLNMHHLLALPWNLCMTLTSKMLFYGEIIKYIRESRAGELIRSRLVNIFSLYHLFLFWLYCPKALGACPRWRRMTRTKAAPSLLQEAGTGNPELEEVQPQPLDMSIPTDSCRAALTYFALLPIVFPLWLTLPDTRKHSGESWQDVTNAFQFSGRWWGGGGKPTSRPLLARHV